MVLKFVPEGGGTTQWLVSDKQFHSLRDVVQHYKTNHYKDIKLGKCAREEVVGDANHWLQRLIVICLKLLYLPG
jgi:hypothetical protein